MAKETFSNQHVEKGQDPKMNTRIIGFVDDIALVIVSKDIDEANAVLEVSMPAIHFCENFLQPPCLRRPDTQNG